MAASTTTFLSPGVYSIETDVSQIPTRASDIGGAFIGVTRKGPAFYPTSVKNFSEFRTVFGGLHEKMYMPYAVRSYIAHSPVATIVRVLGKGNPANGYLVDLGRAFVFGFGANDVVNTVASAFTANLSAIETMAVLRSRQNSSGVDLISDVSYTGTAQSFTANIGGTIIPGLSLDRTRSNYIKNILGTDPKNAHNGDAASGVYVDSVLDYLYGTFTGSYTGSAYGSLNNAASGSVSGIRYISGGYKTAETPLIVSQPYISGTAAVVYDLFKLISRTDGEASNYDCKISFLAIETSTASSKIAPKFSLQVRAYEDTDKRPQILESFRVDLNSESPDYIAKKIGNTYYSITIDAAGSTPKLVPMGDWVNKSNFVYVSMSEGYKFDSRPAGFRGPKGINPFVGVDSVGNTLYENSIPLKTDHTDDSGFRSSKIFLGFDFEGTNAVGFEDRLKGSFCAVDSTYTSKGFLITATTGESTTFTPSVSAQYNNSLTSAFTFVDTTLTGSTTIIQNAYQFSLPLLGGHDGIAPSVDYDKAINSGALSAEFISALGVLSNPDAIDMNLLVIPGVHNGAALYNGQITSRAIEMVENRQDTFYLMDSAKTLTPSSTNITAGAVDTTVQEAVDSVEGYDTNRAATYYPWLRIYDVDNNNLVWVPPTVEVAGVYSFTDKISHPWFAPAGFNRASLNRVLQLRNKLTLAERDILHEGRVNPIAFFVGQGPVVYAQRNLQQIASAMDRVNVVRLLIFIEKMISGIARTQQFEQNDPRTRQILRDTINPFLARVQAQRGLQEYKFIVDESVNTPQVVDNNELRGYFLLKPSRTAEKIIFNYVVTSSGASFEQVFEQIV